MEIGKYFRILLKGWWIVLLTTLAAIAIALISSLATLPMYRVSASFIVSPNKAIVPNQNLADSLGTLDKRSIIATYAEIINSARIFNEATTALQMDSNELRRYAHSAVVLPDANVVVLSVTGPDPQRAAQLANSIGQRTINYAKGLYQAYDISQLDPAIPASAPYVPQPLRDLTLALGLGLVLGSVLAIASSHMQVRTAPHRRQVPYEGATQNYYSRVVQPRRE